MAKLSVSIATSITTLGLSLLPLALVHAPAVAQSLLPSPTAPPISPIVPAADGTGTLVDSVGGDRFTITGGTRSSNGQNLFHSFEKFGLNANQAANFIAAPEIQNILGRITGGAASHIDGLVQVSNGSANLFLINPAGILTGVNARIDLFGSFTATTADQLGFGEGWLNALGGSDYSDLNGTPDRFQFSTANPGNILNQGQISVGSGQAIRLLGGSVVNIGTLTAPEGEITLLSNVGAQTVNFGGDGAIALGTNAAGNPLLSLDSSLNPLNVSSIADMLLQTSVAQASGLSVDSDGTVRLEGMAIPTEAGVAIASGQLTADGKQGGKVQALGDRVGLFDAQINASGQDSGGTVLIGGEYQGNGIVPNARETLIGANSTIQANALGSGQGGRVIAWADDTTGFYGKISAQGGDQGGDGGLIEVSGKQTLLYRGNATAAAKLGQPGMLLLDPVNLIIRNGTGDSANDGNSSFQGNVSGAIGSFFDFAGDNAPTTIFESEIEGLSGDTSVSLYADSITIENLSDNQLTFAPGNGPNNAINFVTASGGSFSMNPGDTLDSNGRTVQISSGTIRPGHIRTEGGDLILAGDVILAGDTTLATDGGDLTLGADSGFSNLQSDSNATLRNLTLDVGNGTLNFNSLTAPTAPPDNLSLQLGTLNLMDNRTLRAENDITISAANTLDLSDLSNSHFDVRTGRDLILTAPEINLNDIGISILDVGRDLRLNATTTAILEASQLRASRDVVLSADTLTIPSGGSAVSRLEAGRNLTISGSTVALRGQVHADGNLLISADDVTLDSTQMESLQQLSLNVANTANLEDSTLKGDSLLISAQMLEGEQWLEAGNLLQLQIQESIDLSDIKLVSGDGAIVRSLNGSILANDASWVVDQVVNDLQLEAAQNISLDQPHIQVGRDLTLIAGEAVTVTDGSQPAILSAGEFLTIQSNNAITLDGFRDPDSRFEAGQDLTLRSDGPIRVNGRLLSGTGAGGNLIVERLSDGSPADFVSSEVSFTTLLRANGDVTFGDYEGPSLKIVATGSINGGDINVVGPNPSLTGNDVDLLVLQNQEAVFLEAGVTDLGGSENLPPNQAVGGTMAIATPASNSTGNLSPGDLTVGNILDIRGPVRLKATGDITIGEVVTQEVVSGSPVPNHITISSSGGSVTTTDLFAERADIRVAATGENASEARIATGELFANKGDVYVTATGDITTANISNGGLDARATRTELMSTEGGVQFNTIDAGSDGLYIDAATFVRGLGSRDRIGINKPLVNDPGLIDYLVSQGFERSQLEAANVVLSGSESSPRSTIVMRPANANAEGLAAPIFIRYGDRAETLLDRDYTINGQPSKILIEGDSQQAFRLGPAFDGQPIYQPADPTDNLADYDPVTNNFAFAVVEGRALVIDSDEFPADASGLVAGIVVGEGTNDGFYASLQDQSFDPPPAVAEGGGSGGNGDVDLGGDSSVIGSDLGEELPEGGNDLGGAELASGGDLTGSSSGSDGNSGGDNPGGSAGVTPDSSNDLGSSSNPDSGGNPGSGNPGSGNPGGADSGSAPGEGGSEGGSDGSGAAPDTGNVIITAQRGSGSEQEDCEAADPLSPDDASSTMATATAGQIPCDDQSSQETSPSEVLLRNQESAPLPPDTAPAEFSQN